MNMNEFRELLKCVDRSYDDFVSAVISYVKMPGNIYLMQEIASYIKNNPNITSSDVLNLIMRDINPENHRDTVLSMLT